MDGFLIVSTVMLLSPDVPTERKKSLTQFSILPITRPYGTKRIINVSLASEKFLREDGGAE